MCYSVQEKAKESTPLVTKKDACLQQKIHYYYYYFCIMTMIQLQRAN